MVTSLTFHEKFLGYKAPHPQSVFIKCPPTLQLPTSIYLELIKIFLCKLCHLCTL